MLNIAPDLGWRVVQSLNLPHDQRTELQTRINAIYDELKALVAAANAAPSLLGVTDRSRLLR